MSLGADKIYEVEDAIRAITGELSSVTVNEVVSLKDSSGRILSEDIIAPISVPSFPKSAMDGYAVRSEDIKEAGEDSPVTLNVIASIMAGDKTPESVKTAGDLAGTAVRIMTGGMVPEGYDTVIRQEDTDYGEEQVKIYKAQGPFVNYCKVGEDIMEGTSVVSKGTLIGRAEAGVIASLGITEVNVLRKIRVSMISTGSEIVNLGQELQEAKIYNNIAYMIGASLNKPAFEYTSSSVPDDIDDITDAIRRAEAESDIILTTGGVSVGQKDLLPKVVELVGAKKLFDRINIKPGSPTIGANLNGKALLCLSGNPYAAVANFDLYVGHIIAAITGCDRFIPVREKAVLRSEFNKPSNVRRFVRAYVSSGEVTILNKHQESSVLSSYLGANCYIDVPCGSTIKEGDTVDILRISEALL